MKIDFEWLKNELRLAQMNKKDRDILAATIEPLFVLPGVPVIHQGALGSDLYLLRSGSVHITRMTGTHEVALSSGEYGKVFGEISMFSDEPISVNVIADQACTIYKISYEKFCLLLEKHSDIALKLLAFVVRNMGATIRRLDSKRNNGNWNS